ncbi:hypothetical protein [Kitasatospora sp. A2-31]|uniref:hypothetical protein n=1 Tax=Kitasatospora sp. A2-31 TaxID=2916414 RepID=UPI001EEA6A21|nr:hypothetical protein [Kitasatospora sp. A2-31]MCG6493873.1 hypothetical protein [Kitasatospora sp. A2-31]
MDFHRAEDRPAGYRIASQTLFAPEVRQARVLLAVERGRWTCSLFAYDDEPPTDDSGRLAFAKGLRDPHLAEQIERRTVREPTYRYSDLDDQWRRYHAGKERPERLVARRDRAGPYPAAARVTTGGSRRRSGRGPAPRGPGRRAAARARR